MKYKIYIGKNGIGKTSKLFTDFHDINSKVQLKETNSFQKFTNYKLFIPSIRVVSENNYVVIDYTKEELHASYINLLESKFGTKDIELKDYYDIWNTLASKYVCLFFEKIYEEQIIAMEELVVGVTKLNELYKINKTEFINAFKKSNDGLKSLVTIIGAMFECRELSKNVGVKAYIFIDEIENHTYPRLQKYVIDMCNDILNEIDGFFYFSTHSPIAVISHSIENFEVIDIENEEKKLNERQVRSKTYDVLLETLFEMPTQNNREKQIFQLVNKHMNTRLDEYEVIQLIDLQTHAKENNELWHKDKKYRKVLDKVVDFYA